MKDYLQQAAQTAPKTIVGTGPSTLLIDCLKEIVRVGNDLDAIKKHMFYGKELQVPDQDELRWNNPLHDLPSQLKGLEGGGLVAVEIIHGIVGSITETVELAEALLHAIESGEPIDIVNLSEECGDVLWYLACILRHSGKDFPDLMEQNIAKLRKRYPNGFLAYDALHRDLGGERQVLEQAQGKYGALVDENDKPIEKPVYTLRNALLLPRILPGQAPLMRLSGDRDCEGGSMGVVTSRVINYDRSTDTWITRNSVYKVVSWAEA